MQKFLNKKTGETQFAYSLYERGDKFVIKFRADGTEYRYSKDTIELLNNVDAKASSQEIASEPAKDCANSNRLTVELQTVTSNSLRKATSTDNEADQTLIVYSLPQPCYRCKENTEVFTYIVFDDGTNENVVYPWDKKRLNDNKSYEHTLAHMSNEDIEFYPIKILGSDEIFDQIMIDNFPNNISMVYSKTQKRTYPMNCCQHCRAKQGEYYIYEKINKLIANKTNLDIHSSILILP